MNSTELSRTHDSIPASAERNPDSYVIGVDVGGTKIACTLVDRHGRVFATHQAPSHTADLEVCDSIAQAIQHIIDRAGDKQILGIGLGCPGQVDGETGTVNNAVNMGWGNSINLVAELQQRLGLPVPIVIGKDTTALALGEHFFGNAGDNFVLISIGTGVGAAAIVNGEPVLGTRHFAMELGHMSLVESAVKQPNMHRLCSCGLYGCPEMYISGTGLLAGVQEHAAAFPTARLTTLLEQNQVSTADILHLARSGDEMARRILHDAARVLGKLLMFCAVAFNPTRIVISGGLGHAAADLMLPEAEQILRASTLSFSHADLQITLSQVESAVGAACLVWKALKQ